MSLQPKEMAPVPGETVRIARATFPKGNAWLSLRDELGTIYSDEMFVGLYPSRGQPAGTPCRLALVLVMQLPMACRCLVFPSYSQYPGSNPRAFVLQTRLWEVVEEAR